MENIERKFEDRIIGLTGYSSKKIVLDEAVARIIQLEGGKVVGDWGTYDCWEVEQIVVVGDEDFNKEYLIESVEIGIKHNFNCRYFSLEDFWDYWIDEELFEPYFEGDPRIDEHKGLAFLASLGFDYPTVDIFSFGNKSQKRAVQWNEESILMEQFGYSVRAGVSEKKRRRALAKAVESPEIISLQEIAKHIVLLINTRKANENMLPAVRRWKSDLDWLKANFYDDSVHSFVFPSL